MHIFGQRDDNHWLQQKILNTPSSRETELVAAYYFIPDILWNNYFFEAQVYKSTDTLLYQYNQSAIILKIMAVSLVASALINWTWCIILLLTKSIRSKLMLSNVLGKKWSSFFTKPLQGELFLKFISIIMNLKKWNFAHHIEVVCWWTS